jgi:hypothetical protein|tara:strand:+ start:369 stop:530 length:162 start_codon:yes stop_codon:yes gene_type:complete
MAKLQHKLMALHLHTTTPVPPKLRRPGRFLLELVGLGLFMTVFFFLLVIVGDA